MRRHQQVLIPSARRGACVGVDRRAGPAQTRLARRAHLIAASVAIVVLAGCANVKPTPEAGPMAVARLTPKNGSTVRGLVSFTQRGDKVTVTGNFVELYPGPHSLYIHAIGNCGSRNAASAGPVWNAAAAPAGSKRSGDLPELVAGGEGYATLAMSSSELSVGTGKANDVIGHSVVIHATRDPDPKAEFGVPNGWLACGVIERSEGIDLKKYY
jgi:superoxide dismutase, Cu-Zn family